MRGMPARRRNRRSWFVYLIECCDGTLYTGVALDVDRRVAEHNEGRGGRYTRGRAPVQIVAASRALDKRAAYRLEWRVKQLRACDKPGALVGPPARRSRRRASDE
jgi:putative endonuclease